MDITFDCYGTLLDTRPIRTQFMTFSARHGIDGQAAWHQFESWGGSPHVWRDHLAFHHLIEARSAIS